MAIIAAQMTKGGAPYNGFTPTINIWKISDGSLVVSAAAMTQISTSGIYKYDFTTGVYGQTYAYQITGDSTVSAPERYQWGTIYLDTTDRVIGAVVTDAGNSATQFKSDRTESTTGHWNDCLCKFLTGALAEQVKKVTGYNGSTFIMSFTAGFTGTPAVGDIYELINI
jgi:hypothetical protein